jgi:predicted short-subunit dehydrogenase-like oxidoreductase (DUF2520 family)
VKIGIIGFGLLGETLAKAHIKLGNLDYLVIRSREKFDIVNQLPDKNFKLFSNINQIDEFADLNILLVKDDQIEDLANQLSNLSLNFQNKIFIHCSGLLDLSVLIKIAINGGLIACAHPYQTFWSKSDEVLNNVPWLVECNEKFNQIEKWISSLNGRVFNQRAYQDNSIDKTGYHLSAVFVSNFMNLLFYLSKQTSRFAGINPVDFIPEISKTTIENNLKNLSNEAFTLTGPIARGDLSTLIKHIEFLDNHSEIKNSYIYLTLATLEIAKNSDLISFEKFNEIKEFLESKMK